MTKKKQNKLNFDTDFKKKPKEKEPEEAPIEYFLENMIKNDIMVLILDKKKSNNENSYKYLEHFYEKNINKMMTKEEANDVVNIIRVNTEDYLNKRVDKINKKYRKFFKKKIVPKLIEVFTKKQFNGEFNGGL